MLVTIKGSQLKPGMVIRPDPRGKPHIVGKLTGRCEKGLHYGSGCYDRIGEWYLDTEEQNVRH